MENSKFYDVVSSKYDKMINFNKSLENKRNALSKFILPDYKNTLDLGCGTGVDSIALAQLKLNVDAIDHSSEMLNKANQNARKYNVSINFVHSKLSTLKMENKKYDLIVSLGNTIVNISKHELDSTIKNISALLKQNGKIIIQIINYAMLPKSGEYNLKEFDDGLLHIHRKYNIHESFIDFIIEITDKTTNKVNSLVTKIYPYYKTDFTKYANQLNFDIKFFGNLNKDHYIESKSPNLIIEMSKI